MYISPSIASSNQLKLMDSMDYINNNFEEIHVDIEDGNYIPDNISFGFKTARAICGYSQVPVSMHLMVNDPMKWIEDVRSCNPYITFLHTDHIENPVEVLRQYKKVGLNVGLGLSNHDLKRNIDTLLNETCNIIMLTASIEDHNQLFDYKLVEYAKSFVDQGFRVWLDGGIKKEYFDVLKRMGFHAAVMGRAIFQT